MTEIKTLSHVVIGAGAGIFKGHQKGLDLETTNLVAVSDLNAEAGQQRADEAGCAFFLDHRAMLAEMQLWLARDITQW